MDRIKKVFNYFDRGYLIKQYIFSALPFLFLIFMKGIEANDLLVFTMCFLLYPFARYPYDHAEDAVFGNMKFMPLISFKHFFWWRFITFFVIWFFSIFIAPFVVLYVLYRTRDRNFDLVGKTKDIVKKQVKTQEGMTKKEWIEYFKAVNRREPSADEIKNAESNGEFRKTLF